MSISYKTELHARFGENLELGEGDGDHPDSPWLRQLLMRRTHRRFDDRPVPEARIKLMLAAAVSASSKSDFQQVSIIRVKDRTRRVRLGALFPDMPWIATAPAFLVFCGDARRLERVAGQHRLAPDTGTFEGFFNATVDAALALQTCTLAAEAVGLGCCAISVLRNHIAEVGEILALPDKVFPVAGLCVGYPADAGFISMRLPLAATVHVDRYDDSRLADVVDAYDRRRDKRFSIGDRQRKPERFGIAEFYGWSADKARQAMDPDGADFAPWLRAHGFPFE
jgi:FMN reductase [NAD(P)H]